MRGFDFHRNPLLGNAVSDHAASRDFGDLYARCFGDEWNRAACAGVNFKDIDFGLFGDGIFNGKLHVHKTDDTEGFGH